MKTLAIVGGGCAGTMLANRMRRKLADPEWSIVCVDRDAQHHYQPGYLYLPFGIGSQSDILRPKRKLIDRDVELVIDEVRGIDVDARALHTAGGRKIAYDFLVLAAGCRIAPEEVDGLEDVWGKTAFDFYTLDGAQALGGALSDFEGGRIVVDIAELPYKCPIAPMEFAYLADDYFKRRGIRSKVELVLATPAPDLLHMDLAAAALRDLCLKKGIEVVTDFAVGDVGDGKITEMGGASREIEFDLLVCVPPNLGDSMLEETGLDDGNAGYVPTDPRTLKARDHERIYVMGDAADLPTSKAGSVAHFSVPIVSENLLAEIDGREPPARFDGHANCFIETGRGKALMVDFSYDTEALPGVFPAPVVGPFSLLKETRLNHWGKVMSGTLYWHLLLRDRPFPVPDRFSMQGKRPRPH